MNRLLLILMLIPSLLMAQDNPNYNPDFNGDGFIGSQDLLGFLPIFGGPFFSTDSVVTVNYCLEGDTEINIAEDTDIVLATIWSAGNCIHTFNLPEGLGRKAIMAMFWCPEPYDPVEVQFTYSGASPDYYNGTDCAFAQQASPTTVGIPLTWNSSSRYLLLLRGENGVWFFP